MQDVVPGVDQAPSGQQTPAPLLLYFPVGQAREEFTPAKQNDPAGQAKQDAELVAP